MIRVVCSSLACLALLHGCGRVRFTPQDAAGIDAATTVDAATAFDATIDAAPPLDTGLDARALDAWTRDDVLEPDAYAPDAYAPDAYVPDAPSPDAGRDAGSSTDAGPACRSRLTWLDGPGSDWASRVVSSGDSTLFVQVGASAPGLLPGLLAGDQTVRLDGDAVTWTRAGAARDLALDVDSLLVLHLGGLTRISLVTGRGDVEIGTATPSVSNAAAIATDGRGGIFVAMTVPGASTWNGTDLGTTGHDVALAWLDGAGVLQRAWALGGTDTDVAWDVAAVGTEMIVVGNSNVPPLCVGATCGGANAYALRVEPGGGARFETTAVQPSFEAASDSGGNLYTTGGMFSSVDATGGLRYVVSSPLYARIAVDEPRGRVFVVGRMVSPLFYGSTRLDLLGAGETLVVLAFDLSTGALLEALRFGGTGTTEVAGVTVTPSGTLVVAGSTATSFSACSGELAPAISGQAGFLLTIAP